MQYMRAQLRRVGRPAPKVIGIDEVSIRKGHSYRIVVSDLLRRRPIWFGGMDRSEASLDEFFAWLGARHSAGIRLVVMDMWKAFRNSTRTHAPQASIPFDKFHVLRHLGDALDTVRKSEYARVGTAAGGGHLSAAFKQEMREEGYVEGQRVLFEQRFGEGKRERLSEAASELVRLKVDIMVTSTECTYRTRSPVTIFCAHSATPSNNSGSRWALRRRTNFLTKSGRGGNASC